MAIGIERIADITHKSQEKKTLISFIILSDKIEQKAYKIAHDLRSRNNNLIIEVQLLDSSLKSKLRRANKDNASYAIILGKDEIESDKVLVKSLLDDNSDQKELNVSELEGFVSTL